MGCPAANLMKKSTIYTVGKLDLKIMLFLNSTNGMLLQLKENIYCLNCPNCVLSTVKQQPIISLPCDGSKLTGLCLSLNNQHIHVRVLSIILANSQRKKHRGVFCKWKIIAALRDSGVAADLKRGCEKEGCAKTKTTAFLFFHVCITWRFSKLRACPVLLPGQHRSRLCQLRNNIACKCTEGGSSFEKLIQVCVWPFRVVIAYCRAQRASLCGVKNLSGLNHESARRHTHTHAGGRC